MRVLQSDYSHPEVQSLARLLLEARQERGVCIKPWYETTDATRTALLLDAIYVLRARGILAPITDTAKVA